MPEVIDRMDRTDRMERLARSALRWDGGYCIVMGAAAAAFFAPVAETIGASKPLVAIGGIVVAGYGAVLARLSMAVMWWRVTTAVVVVNLAAVAALLVGGFVADAGTAGWVVLGAAAIQVFAFAAVQAHALWSPFGRA